MALYHVAGHSIDSADPALPTLLARVYGEKTRPLCLCRSPGIEMYVSRLAGKYLVKRMPNTGGDHAPACDSYEPPPELSGLGQVIGSAIQENPDEGTTALRFDFSLSKGATRSPPAPSGAENHAAATDGNKLSLRGTLHYLWEQAGFHRWAPTMSGKRSWYVIRKYLLLAAENKTAKGLDLPELLYIPETFSAEHKAEITQRRIAQMMRVAAPEHGPRRLMLIIGEVKELAPSRYGHRVVLKHLPDCPFMMNGDIHKRLLKRFEVELGLWDALDGTHLMMISTFSISATGITSIEEAALMCVTENWVPFESTFDKMAIDALTHQNRRFMKGLRYNLPSTRPLACAVTSDTVPPTAMYVIPPSVSDDYKAAVDELIAESTLPSWVWFAGEAVMPALPPSTK